MVWLMTRIVTPTSRGQSLVELLAGLVVIIPVVLFLIDAGTLFLGATENNQVCRDSARAAASGEPGDVTTAGSDRDVPAGKQPFDRAASVIRRTCKPGGAIRMSPDPKVTETLRAPLPTQPFGGPVDGEVTVETTVTVYPPFLVSTIVGPGGVSFKTSQTFPYTWVMSGTMNQGVQSPPAK